MAVKRDSRYPGRWTPADADFPLGGPKNRTTSTSQDGSYFNRDFIADYEAFFQRLMAEGGVTANETPDTAPTSQFFEAMLNINSQEYLSTKVYSYGDVVQKTIGGVKRFFQWYSNVESLAGKDPELDANRRAGWSDTTKPFYWLPYSPKVAGETMHWDTDDIPENMVVGIGQQLPVAVYHTLADAKPEWIDGVDNTLINIPDRQGRFTRAANGTTWLSGNTHEDQNKEHSHRIGGAVVDSDNGDYPNSIFASAKNGTPPFDSGYDQESNPSGGSEAMPKGYIEWVGYAL